MFQILLSVSVLSRFRIIQNNTVMRILLVGTTVFVHIEQVSAVFTFRLGQVLLYETKFKALYVYITFCYLFRVRSVLYGDMMKFDFKICVLYPCGADKSINILKK
jgi:putative copper export protein